MEPTRQEVWSPKSLQQSTPDSCDTLRASGLLGAKVASVEQSTSAGGERKQASHETAPTQGSRSFHVQVIQRSPHRVGRRSPGGRPPTPRSQLGICALGDALGQVGGHALQQDQQAAPSGTGGGAYAPCSSRTGASEGQVAQPEACRPSCNSMPTLPQHPRQQSTLIGRLWSGMSGPCGGG